MEKGWDRISVQKEGGDGAKKRTPPLRDESGGSTEGGRRQKE